MTSATLPTINSQNSKQSSLLLQAVRKEQELRKKREDDLAACAKREAGFDSGPLKWLTQHTKTFNPKYIAQNLPQYGSFPKHEYFVPVFRYFLTDKRVFVPKSREMLTSWCGMGYASWIARFQPGSEIIIQTQKEEDVKDLVHYCRVLLEQQDQWMLDKCKVVGDSVTTVELANGSIIHGVPQGANQIRHSHPTLFVIDEAAFLAECGQSYDNAHPVSDQIIAISSANPGWFAVQCDKNNAI